MARSTSRIAPFPPRACVKGTTSLRKSAIPASMSSGDPLSSVTRAYISSSWALTGETYVRGRAWASRVARTRASCRRAGNARRGESSGISARDNAKLRAHTVEAPARTLAMNRQAGGHWCEPSTAHFDPLSEAETALLSGPDANIRAGDARTVHTPVIPEILPSKATGASAARDGGGGGLGARGGGRNRSRHA